MFYMKDEYTGTGVADLPDDDTKASERQSALGAGTASPNGDRPQRGAVQKSHGPPKSVWREYFESAVVTVIMALFGMTFIVQAVKVPTGSMQNTILIGDHLLVNKFIFAPGPILPFLPQREIRRGDIIVFKYPGDAFDKREDLKPDNIPYKTNFVKRVIGLPGDRIEVRGAKVLVNGEVLPEQRLEAEDPGYGAAQDDLRSKSPLIVAPSAQPKDPSAPYSVYYLRDTLASSIEGDDDGIYPLFKHEGHGTRIVTVPPTSYFVMGDNRDNSRDSRYWGFVPRDLIIGRAMFVYWSYDESKPTTNLLFNFFTNTRWSRTGAMVK
jgi:signal peptidase I